MKKKQGVSGVVVAGAIAVFWLLACSVPENEVVRIPVSGIEMVKNQSLLLPRDSFELLEGESVILGARLFPEGIAGGIHWQSSSRGIVEMSGFSGPEITITGANGGKTIISVFARNIRNEVYVEAECTVTVIPRSYFKWDYSLDGWLELPALSNAIIGKVSEMLVRSGETPIPADPVRGGLVLEGPGTLVIGSVLSSPTNSPFPSDPLYDKGGMLDFRGGPAYSYLEWRRNAAGTDFEQVLVKKHYPLWNNRVRISVDYETADTAASPLRIQVNNNTLERNNASAITNWLVTELEPVAARSGTLSGILDADASALAVNGVTLDEVLSNSFVCLSLPEGKVLIRGIRIECAD
jgi:hypothetical protein